MIINVAFWNIKDNESDSLKSALKTLVSENEIDLLVLAENDNILDDDVCSSTDLELFLDDRMKKENRWLYVYASKEVKEVLTYQESLLAEMEDNLPVEVFSTDGFEKYLNRFERVLLFSIQSDGDANQHALIAITHMVSRASADNVKQRIFASKVKGLIKGQLDSNGYRYSNRCILFGDFNSNPSDPPMTEPYCFLGHKSILNAEDPKVPYGDDYFSFYNPSHFLNGEVTLNSRQYEVPGTYFFKQAVGEPWNTFDQVLYTAEFHSWFTPNSLQLITTVGGISLVDDKLIPKDKEYSDHLPITFTIQTP